MPSHIGQLHLPDHSPHFLKLRNAVRNLDCPPGPITIGLSGGPDSLALLAAARAEGRTVTALCIDHGLQPNSRTIAETAAQQAQHMGAHAHVHTVTISATTNLEAAARTARYQALTTHANGQPIWLGHTLDDQAETFLLGALRGKPTGMHTHSTHNGAHIYRPLLTVRRTDTHNTCTELGLTPWHDPHNSNPNFLRVRIRTLLANNLDNSAPGDPTPALAQAAQMCAEDEQALATLAHHTYTHSVDADGQLQCSLLGTQPKAIRRRVIASWLRNHGVQVTAAATAGVDTLITNYRGQGAVAVKRATKVSQHTANGKVVGVPPRLVVRRVHGMLVVESVSTSP